MPAVQNLANIALAMKKQSGLGTAATGAGALGLDVTSSQGLSKQMAAIESALIQRTRMRKRPRHGSVSSGATYETELMVGAQDHIFEAVLGGTWAATFDLTEADLTDVTITGTGATITFAGGSVITEGVRVGMMIKFASLSVAENNDVWLPVLAISTNGRVITTEAGLIADNAQDLTFTMTVAKSVSTATPYTDGYWTVEEYLRDLDISKLGTDMRFNALTISSQPDQPTRLSFGLGGINMAYLAAGDSPTFTDPTYVEGQPLVLLDGALYLNSVKRTDLTGATMGLAAPVTTVPVLGSRTSPDVFLGQFAFTGEFTGVVQDATFFDDFDAETQISAMLHFAENETDPADFLSVYVGNLAYGGYSTPVGGEGALIHTIPLIGGEDERGSQFAETTMLVSSSAA